MNFNLGRLVYSTYD